MHHYINRKANRQTWFVFIRKMASHFMLHTHTACMPKVYVNRNGTRKGSGMNYLLYFCRYFVHWASAKPQCKRNLLCILCEQKKIRRRRRYEKQTRKKQRYDEPSGLDSQHIQMEQTAKSEEGNHISAFIRKWKTMFTCVFANSSHYGAWISLYFSSDELMQTHHNFAGWFSKLILSQNTAHNSLALCQPSFYLIMMAFIYILIIFYVINIIDHFIQ